MRGVPTTQRLVEAGGQVIDLPAKLAARVRLFDTGHNRKADAVDAHSIAVARDRCAHGFTEELAVVDDPDGDERPVWDGTS